MEAYRDLVDLLDSWSDDPKAWPQDRLSACQHWLPLLLTPCPSATEPGQATEEQEQEALRSILLEAVVQQLYIAAVQLSCQGQHALADPALWQLGFRARLSDEVWRRCREAGGDLCGSSVDPAHARQSVGAHIAGRETAAGGAGTTAAAAAAAAPEATGNAWGVKDGRASRTAGDGRLRQPLVFDLLGPATDPSGLDVPEPQRGLSGGCSGPGQGQSVEHPLLGPLLPRLQAAFAPASPFWCEHSYQDPSTPYFSYSYRLSDPPHSIVEVAARRLFRLLSAEPHTCSCMAGVTRVEWWAHCREPGHPGHQLHFDVDERRLRQGLASYQLLHPALSSVLFLSGPSGCPQAAADSPPPASAFGPTLVLDQTPRSHGLAARAWTVHPAVGRFLVFPGDLLHGVLPAASCSATLRESEILEQQQQPCRVTLMLAWWADADGADTAQGGEVAAAGSAALGPCMVAPTARSCEVGMLDTGGSCSTKAAEGKSWPDIFAASSADLAELDLDLPSAEAAEGGGSAQDGTGCAVLEPAARSGALVGRPRLWAAAAAAAAHEVAPAWSCLNGPGAVPRPGHGGGSGSPVHGGNLASMDAAAAARSRVEADAAGSSSPEAAAGAEGRELAAAGRVDGGRSGFVVSGAEREGVAGGEGAAAVAADLGLQLHGAQLPGLRFFVRRSDEFSLLYVPDMHERG